MNTWMEVLAMTLFPVMAAMITWTAKLATTSSPGAHKPIGFSVPQVTTPSTVTVAKTY
jgi:hypothetical protein